MYKIRVKQYTRDNLIALHDIYLKGLEALKPTCDSVTFNHVRHCSDCPNKIVCSDINNVIDQIYNDLSYLKKYQ